jgi:hypothetical protein
MPKAGDIFPIQQTAVIRKKEILRLRYPMAGGRKENQGEGGEPIGSPKEKEISSLKGY